MMQLKIVRFKQGITYLLNVAAVTLEDPLGVLLRFVKEHFGPVSVNSEQLTQGKMKWEQQKLKCRKPAIKVSF